MKLGWFTLAFLVGCGGEPFALGDAFSDGGDGGDLDGVSAPDVGSLSTGPEADPPNDAGFDDRRQQHDADGAGMAEEAAADAHAPDAQGVDADDAAVADVTADVASLDVVAVSTLCCVRPSGAALCVDAPWWCCSGDTCAGQANCAAVESDGGSACAAGARCGLIGAPASGTVAPCP